MEEQQIIEIWDLFRDYITEHTREIVATQYLNFLISQDIEVDVIEGLKGYDVHLDKAIESVLEHDTNENFNEDADNWGDDEDNDEDY